MYKNKTPQEIFEEYKIEYRKLQEGDASSVPKHMTLEHRMRYVRERLEYWEKYLMPLMAVNSPRRASPEELEMMRAYISQQNEAPDKYDGDDD